MLILQDITAATDCVAFKAGSAAEMQAKLEQWLADNPTAIIFDMDLNGAGAGPTWVVTLTIGVDGASPSVQITASDVTVFATGGINTVSPRELAQRVNEFADGQNVTVNKLVSAGAGAGPHWMAVALLTPGQGIE